jgi:1,4-alpha-glucan branching enzyme
MEGYLALILTGHVPYLRSAGRAPDGEDLLHETIAHAIVPTLNALFDLRERGIPPTVALAYSPILIEQLADTIVQKHFLVWMEQWIEGCAAEADRCERIGEAHRAYLARFYTDWGQSTLDSFDGRFNRDLVEAMRELCTSAGCEPLAGAATHAYLPLLTRPETLRTQIDTGSLCISRHLGRRSRGMWLPECGYAAPIDQALAGAGMRYTIVDPSSNGGGAGVTPQRPRWVAPRRLIAFIRDVAAGEAIWSPDLGYIGDPLYRSVQRDPDSGLPIWRAGDSEEPELYDPYDAFQRASEHAAHFCAYLTSVLRSFGERHDRPGIVVLPLDAELLGQRWFEGPLWLRAVIEQLKNDRSVRLTTPSSYLRAYRPRQSMLLREGSWGPGGDSRAWKGPATTPIRQALDEAEERLAQLVQQFPDAAGERERALNQALRELLLAQSSDWPLLLNQGVIGDPLQRTSDHLKRCAQLCALAEQPALSEPDRDLLEQLEELDNPFPQLNYRIFSN